MKLLGLIIATVAVATVACGRSSGGSPSSDEAEAALAAVRLEIEAAHARRDAAAFAAVHAESAIFEWQGLPSPLVGRSNIEASRQRLWPSRPDLRLKHNVSELRVHDDRAYEFGSYEETWTDEQGRQVVEVGRYVTGYVRESDGQWRIARLFGFTDSTETKDTHKP